VLSKDDTMTFSSETEKNVELVKKTIEELLKLNDYDPDKLLDYIKYQGTGVCKIPDADKILSLIREEEGLIMERRGFEGLYLNMVTGNGFSTKSEPVFIMRDGEINPFFMIHQFYKWYSLKNRLPGFDYKSQKLFRKYLRAKTQSGMENLNLDEMLGLKEAIARDREATDYAYKTAVEQEGGKKAFDKLNDGGANI
jgi:hypothetical protein